MSILKPEFPKQELKVEAAIESSFSYEDLNILNSPEDAYLLPLAVIGLIDMNAFFAQCEQIRLGKSIDDPVVCCQWKSLVGVSYAARKYGISRFDPLKLALEKCPHLVIGHAAVFKKGQSFWRYLNGFPDQALHKVSLDPYRRELKKIFRILQSQCDLVEKASIDECYLDFGRQVYCKLIELFPELLNLQNLDSLPPIPSKLPEEIRWRGLMYLSEDEKDNSASSNGLIPDEQQFVIVKDWDDICMILGSQFLYDVRGKVYEELKYTTSGGLASTKTIAKLAAGFIKPDSQTLVRPSATNAFLANFELTDVTSMGGIIGRDILKVLQVPPGINSTSYVRKEFTLDQLKEEFTKDLALATKIYEFCRGTHKQKLKFRIDVKSMMSLKNFLSKRPVNTVGDAFDWIKVFVGDLYGRLVELDDESMNLSLLQTLPGKRVSISRPTTVAIHFTTSKREKLSKQKKFPVIKDLVKFRSALEAAYFKLLCQILENSKPCDCEIKYTELSPEDPHLFQLSIHFLANLSVVIGNFVKTTGASLIDSYGQGTREIQDKDLLKRKFDEVNQKAVITEEAPKVKKGKSNSFVKKMLESYEKEQKKDLQKRTAQSINQLSPSRFKEDRDYVNKMFKNYQDDLMAQKALTEMEDNGENFDRKSDSKKEEPKILKSKSGTPELREDFMKLMMLTRNCTQCNIDVEDVFEHRDFHVALDLSLKLNWQEQADRVKVKKKKGTLNQATLPF